MRTLLAALTALMLFATPVVAEDSEDAWAAYYAGDYQKAFRLFKPLAERGDKWAQTTLGVMYDNGEGVPENDAKAFHWYRKAAAQGDGESGWRSLLRASPPRRDCLGAEPSFTPSGQIIRLLDVSVSRKFRSRRIVARSWGQWFSCEASLDMAIIN